MLSGRRYETFAMLEAWNAWVKQSQDALKLAVPLAEKYEVVLAIENHKEDPMEMAEAVAPYVKTVHIKDISVQQYPDEFLMSEVPLGTGMPGVPRIMSASLKAIRI
jgi:3-oxoisoapionate decarboxylase